MNFIALLALSVSIQSAPPLPSQSETPLGLAKGLVEAVNSKDATAMRRYIDRYVLSNVPADERVKVWQGLAEQGAPFKVIRKAMESVDQIALIMVDKAGNRIALIVRFESKPRLMVRGFQLRPAFVIEGSSPDLATWSDVPSLAKKLLAKSRSPGIGIAMIESGAMKVGVAGVRKVGTSDAVQPNDVWSIGSIGKPICSTVIGRLIEKGKLRWDETLKQALPGVPMDSGYANVTLEQVMRHRGGVPADLGFTKAEVDKIVGKATAPQEIRARYVRDILSRKPVATLGTEFIYSNAGYAILTVVAEMATDMPYEGLVREFVFRPLHLEHSYAGEAILPKERASGHIETAAGFKPENMSGRMEFMFAGAGGGMYMSVGDLAKFGLAHLKSLQGRGGILRQATAKRLHEGIPEQPGGNRLYACGWGIQSLPGISTFHGHNGSNGTMRAQLAIFPEADLVVVGIVNRGGESEPAPGMDAVLSIAARYAPKR